MAWVLANWRIAIPLLVTLLGGGVFGVVRCHSQQVAEDAAKAQRLREEAAKALGRAEAREDVAEQLGGLVAPLLDAGLGAAVRADDAARATEVEREHLHQELDAGRCDTTGQLRRDLEALCQ